MRETINRTQKTRIEISKECRVHVSTLSVPERHLCDLENTAGNMEIHHTLRMLLKKYREYIALGLVPKSENVRVRYQKQGQDLVDIKFRPWDSDWAELGILANGLGVTRCWLFSHLLELEFSLMGEFLELPGVGEGVTTLASATPRNIWQFTDNKEQFWRILHFRE